jgi:hypothetical protein
MPDLSLDILQSVSIASPCTARWEDMTGDEKTRHCGECGLNVHNFGAMSEDEIAGVLRIKLDDPAARVCARIYQRADGTMLTEDCPKGLAAVRARVRRSFVRIAAAIGLMSAAGAGAYATSRDGWTPNRLRGAQPFAWISSKLMPRSQSQLPVGQRMLMGDICIPAPPAPARAPSAPTGGQ